MTYDELLVKIDEKLGIPHHWGDSMVAALRAVVEMHKPVYNRIPLAPYPEFYTCKVCWEKFERDDGEVDFNQAHYPCHTIQAIEEKLL
jgi:hypothetical protein